MEINTKKHTQRPRTNQTFTVDKGVACYKPKTESSVQMSRC